MEPIAHLPHTIKGTEVLFFEDAEITKMKGDQKSFATFGNLSVLYFKDFNRFVLQINDWRYPLLRRLHTVSNGNGTYTLPAMNGFTYNLKVNSAGQGIKNLDALLEGTRKLEKSPEDKLIRENLHRKETGTKEVITQTLNQILHKVHNKASTFKIGTKHLTSTRKRTNLKDIKNRNFKKEAHSKIKKDFFKSSEKLSNEFLQKRRDNLNLTQARDLEALRKSDGATMYLPREEIEETILLGKDIFAKSNPMDPTLNRPAEKKGVMGTLKEGIHNVKDALRGGERHAATGVQTEKMPVSAEGMTHYQG